MVLSCCFEVPLDDYPFPNAQLGRSSREQRAFWCRLRDSFVVCPTSAYGRLTTGSRASRGPRPRPITNLWHVLAVVTSVRASTQVRILHQLPYLRCLGA